jgi:hypothetical protein
MDIKALDICLYLSKTEVILSVAMSQVLEDLLVSVKRTVFIILVGIRMKSDTEFSLYRTIKTLAYKQNLFSTGRSEIPAKVSLII